MPSASSDWVIDFLTANPRYVPAACNKRLREQRHAGSYHERLCALGHDPYICFQDAISQAVVTVIKKRANIIGESAEEKKRGWVWTVSYNEAQEVYRRWLKRPPALGLSPKAQTCDDDEVGGAPGDLVCDPRLQKARYDEFAEVLVVELRRRQDPQVQLAIRLCFFSDLLADQHDRLRNPADSCADFSESLTTSCCRRLERWGVQGRWPEHDELPNWNTIAEEVGVGAGRVQEICTQYLFDIASPFLKLNSKWVLTLQNHLMEVRCYV
jgi:hypothetical protein